MMLGTTNIKHIVIIRQLSTQFTLFMFSTIHSLVVDPYATGCKINYALCSQNVSVCAARFSEQTALIEFN